MGQTTGLSTPAVGEGQKLQGPEQSVRVLSGSRWEEKGATYTGSYMGVSDPKWGEDSIHMWGQSSTQCHSPHEGRAAQMARDKAGEEGAQCEVFSEDVITQAG